MAAQSLSFTNLEEIQDLAKAVLPTGVFDYYAGGAESEATLKDNRAAFSRYRLLPRILVDVSRIDTSCTLLGRRLSVPILVAPMSKHKMAHPDGELATVRAAAAEGMGMGVSTMSTCTMEEVAEAGGGNTPCLLFQLYVFKDRDFCKSLIKRCEASGYHALVVTVDAPRLGRREADIRNSFQMPGGMRYENLEEYQAKLREEGKTQLGVYGGAEPSGEVHQAAHDEVDDALTWDFISWLRTVTTLPILIKGVLAPADAKRAVEAGVDGIVVSNHGGRQLDFSPAPVDMIPAIARAVNGRLPVLVDGGVRRGTDVLKALALGADAVLVGRPVLFGLALGGEAGVRRVLSIIKGELELAMALAGCPSLRDVGRSLVITPWDDVSRL